MLPVFERLEAVRQDVPGQFTLMSKCNTTVHALVQRPARLARTWRPDADAAAGALLLQPNKKTINFYAGLATPTGCPTSPGKCKVEGENLSTRS